MQRFLRREEFTTLSRPQLTERLRSLGGDSERFKEKGRNIYVWGVPLASLEVQTEPFDSKDMTAAEAF